MESQTPSQSRFVYLDLYPLKRLTALNHLKAFNSLLNNFVSFRLLHGCKTSIIYGFHEIKRKLKVLSFGFAYLSYFETKENNAFD